MEPFNKTNPGIPFQLGCCIYHSKTSIKMVTVCSRAYEFVVIVDVSKPSYFIYYYQLTFTLLKNLLLNLINIDGMI